MFCVPAACPVICPVCCVFCVICCVYRTLSLGIWCLLCVFQERCVLCVGSWVCCVSSQCHAVPHLLFYLPFTQNSPPPRIRVRYKLVSFSSLVLYPRLILQCPSHFHFATNMGTSVSAYTIPFCPLFVSFLIPIGSGAWGRRRKRRRGKHFQGLSRRS